MDSLCTLYLLEYKLAKMKTLNENAAAKDLVGEGETTVREKLVLSPTYNLVSM